MVGVAKNPQPFGGVSQTTGVMNGIPKDFLSCLPLLTKRSNDWNWLYPLVNVLFEQRENLPPAESGKTDVRTGTYAKGFGTGFY